MLKVVHTKQPNRADTPVADQTMPSFTWAELEDAMLTIAASPRQRDMTPALVSATRKQATFLPPAQVLLEILSLAWVVADESFGELSDP